MTTRPTKRRGATVAFTAATVVGLGLLGTATAQAAPPPPAPCSAEDVTLAASETPSPSEQERRYQLTVLAKPGVTCLLSGAPQDLTFSGPSGALPVPAHTPAPDGAEPVVVSEGRSAAAALSGPATDGPARATSVSITLPGDDAPLRTGWVPGGVDGPVAVGTFTPA